LVQPLLAATVLFVVGLGCDLAKQLFQIVFGGGQHDAVIGNAPKGRETNTDRP